MKAQLTEAPISLKRTSPRSFIVHMLPPDGIIHDRRDTLRLHGTITVAVKEGDSQFIIDLFRKLHVSEIALRKKLLLAIVSMSIRELVEDLKVQLSDPFISDDIGRALLSLE